MAMVETDDSAALGMASFNAMDHVTAFGQGNSQTQT